MLVHRVKELTKLKELEAFLLDGFWDYARQLSLLQTTRLEQVHLICQQVFGSAGPPQADSLLEYVYSLGTSFEVLKGLRAIETEKIKILTFYKYRFITVQLQLYDTPIGRKCVKGYEVERAMLEAFNRVEKGDVCEITTYEQLVSCYGTIAARYKSEFNLDSTLSVDKVAKVSTEKDPGN